MKIVRLKKGQNDFAIGNLTLGKLECIREAFKVAENVGYLGPVGLEFKQELEYFFERNPSIECFGSDLVDKIKPRQP